MRECVCGDVCGGVRVPVCASVCWCVCVSVTPPPLSLNCTLCHDQSESIEWLSGSTCLEKQRRNNQWMNSVVPGVVESGDSIDSEQV